MELNIQDWEEFLVGRLFDSIYKAKAHTKEDVDEVEKGLNFVSRTENNNGVDTHVSYEEYEGIEMGNCITIGDTTATCYYQDKPFIAGDHMVVLRSKWMNRKNGLFLRTLFAQEYTRYCYGRAYKMDLIKGTRFKLPIEHNEDGTPVIDTKKTYSDEGYIPDWQFINDFINSLHSEPITTKISGDVILELEFDKWEEFYLKDLFICCMGNGIDAAVTTSYSPEYNYVSRDSKGNGVVDFVDAVYKTDKKGNVSKEPPFESGTMTLSLGGSFLGSCFIQKEPYYTAQNVAVLTEKEPLSIHSKLFISTLIRNECRYKYLAFGRELNTHYKTDFSIKLPIKRDDKGKPVIDSEKKYSDEGYIPDWQLMEDYIKSLPYSDRI